MADAKYLSQFGVSFGSLFLSLSCLRFLFKNYPLNGAVERLVLQLRHTVVPGSNVGPEVGNRGFAPGRYLNISHNIFHPNTSQFIIHKPYAVRCYLIIQLK
jgi:hypothetical protein